MANKNGHWYTDKNGNHYFVENGQSPKEGWEASKRRKMIDGGEYKVSEDGNEYKSVSRDEYDKFEADDDFDINNEDDFGFDEDDGNDKSIQRFNELNDAIEGADYDRMENELQYEVQDAYENGEISEDQYNELFDKMDKVMLADESEAEGEDDDLQGVANELVERNYFKQGEIKDIRYSEDGESLEITTDEGTKQYDYVGGRLYDHKSNDEDAIWDSYNKGEINENKRNELLSKRSENISKPSIDYDEIERRKQNAEPKDEMGIYLDKQMNPKDAEKIRKAANEISNKTSLNTTNFSNRQRMATYAAEDETGVTEYKTKADVEKVANWLTENGYAKDTSEAIDLIKSEMQDPSTIDKALESKEPKKSLASQLRKVMSDNGYGPGWPDQSDEDWLDNFLQMDERRTGNFSNVRFKTFKDRADFYNPETNKNSSPEKLKNIYDFLVKNDEGLTKELNEIRDNKAAEYKKKQRAAQLEYWNKYFDNVDENMLDEAENILSKKKFNSIHQKDVSKHELLSALSILKKYGK